MNVKPKSRLENLLAKIAGRDDAKEIKTKTKGEELLNEIAENGGGGGGGASGGIVVEFTYIAEGDYYKQYFRSVQTAGQVRDAYLSGMPVVFHFPAVEGWFSNDMYCSMIGICVTDTYTKGGGGGEYGKFPVFCKSDLERDNTTIFDHSEGIGDYDDTFDWGWYID